MFEINKKIGKTDLHLPIEETGIQIVTSHFIPGYEIKEVKGLVWGSSVRAKFILKDLVAGLRVMAGGEVKEYWELLNETRHDVLKQLNVNANTLGANAIINVKMATSQVVPGTIELLAYGTAVVIEKE